MKAFSLIELMVVIAIVAILAAVAAPAYNQYIRKSKISSVIPVLDDVGNKAKKYYDQNGDFTYIMSQIGYPDSFANVPATVADYAIPPYIARIAIGGQEYAPGRCAMVSFGATISNLDNTGAFTAATNFPQYQINQQYVLSPDNIWIPICYYYDALVSGANFTLSDIDTLNNCYNVGIPAESTEFSAAFNALLAACP